MDSNAAIIATVTAIAFLLVAIGRFFKKRSGAPVLAPGIYNRDDQV